MTKTSFKHKQSGFAIVQHCLLLMRIPKIERNWKSSPKFFAAFKFKMEILRNMIIKIIIDVHGKLQNLWEMKNRSVYPSMKEIYIPFRNTKQKYVRTTYLINKSKLFIMSPKPPPFTMIPTLANGSLTFQTPSSTWNIFRPLCRHQEWLFWVSHMNDYNSLPAPSHLILWSTLHNVRNLPEIRKMSLFFWKSFHIFH